MDDSHRSDLPFWLRAQLFAPKEKVTMEKCPQKKHNLDCDYDELYCEECMAEQYSQSLKDGRKAAFAEVATELNELAADLFLKRDDKAAGVVRNIAEKYLKKA